MEQQYQIYPVINRSNEKITHTCCYIPIDERMPLSFFKNVMIKLGHYDWSIRFCNDNYCWIEHKRIDINLTYDGDVHQIILHEIAHIDTAKYCNQKHNPDFWKRLNYLTWKFLKKDLDEHQKRHKKYQTNGLYNMRYKN
jgi:hypothetical protein